ncbi:hypothetical protein [Streptomyces sp. NPDC015131]|uniref:hypothetical protein n=1 Tax=Streptomyces sp. NPDC015131 TaxID=3364941 RepID=UPI0036F75F25
MTGHLVRTTALVAAAALRGDATAVRLLLRSLDPDHAAAVTEAAVLSMAELVREAITPEAVQNAIHDAQQLAHQAATEGDMS